MMLSEIEDKNPNLELKFVPAAEQLKAGLVSDHIYAFENGQKVGYLKIDRVEPKLFKEQCPDVWAYRQEFDGKQMWSDSSTPISEKSFSELVKALRSGYMHRHIGYWCKEMKWPSDQCETMDQIANAYPSKPNDEIEQYHDLVLKFFNEWPKKTDDGRRSMKKMKDTYAHFSKPFVAYINTKVNRHQGLEADNSRRGIGTTLYLAGAKWIKDRKIAPGLYASSLQSDDAQAMWKKFEREGLVVQDGKRKYLKG